MKHHLNLWISFVLLVLVASQTEGCKEGHHQRWSVKEAKQWSDETGWLRGSNFSPGTAINQLEMWQAETFDTTTIDRELGWAENIGMNCMRVFLHHLAWQIDKEGFKNRMEQYLAIADRHGIKTMFVFFDDCWNPVYHAGKQPDPVPEKHNSGWVQDPGKLLYQDSTLMTVLEDYVKDILSSFKDDKRVAIWDLYNEPKEGKNREKSLPLLRQIFEWAREVGPSQPLTSAVWKRRFKEVTHFQLENSDVITYHTYDPPEEHQEFIDTLKTFGRPMICSEYMMRINNSLFRNIMPMLKKQNIGAINWGLVTGKTNTRYPWSKFLKDSLAKKIWFHDIFHPDGRPYDPVEIDTIKALTGTPRPPAAERLAWWHDARFGMFIHWGVYSMYGGVYKGYHQAYGDAAWIENRCKIPVAEYREHAKDFNPVNYNPETWVKMAKDAGMKYLIITAKHHDGFALFDSKASDWDVVDATVYGKDLLKPLAEACKKYGIRLGFYYSQANDWTNPGGTCARRPMWQGWPNPDSTRIDQYTKEHNGSWDPVQETATFDEYVDRVAVPQVKELLTNYGDVSVLWWDYPTQMKSYQGALKLEKLLNIQPNIITNDRLHPDFPGDTKTPEQAIPDRNAVAGENWETCMTMNGSWGYKSYDDNWKSSEKLIQNLVKIIARGGNYLLNIGPKPDGSVPQASIDRLKNIGRWMAVNGEAVYGTQASPLAVLPWGECTCKEQNDQTVLYLEVFDWPKDGKLIVPHLKNKVVSASLLADNERLVTSPVADNLLVVVPKIAPDQAVSVIKLEVKGKVEKAVADVKKQMKTGALD